MEKSVEMVRVNTRISSTLNDKLDQESKETGIPKSTLVMIALENYYQQKEAVKSMTDLNQILRKLDELQEVIDRRS